MKKLECEGHPAGPNDVIGQTVYCDGSCNRKKTPNGEQCESLRRFAAANGRDWKAKLRDLWMSGAYGYAVLGGADSAHLQQIRNAFGPTWLTKFSLKVVANAQK